MTVWRTSSWTLFHKAHLPSTRYSNFTIVEGSGRVALKIKEWPTVITCFGVMWLDGRFEHIPWNKYLYFS